MGRFGQSLPARDGTLLVSLERGAEQIAEIVRALDDAGFSGEDIPEFRLAETPPLMHGRVAIIGMNLQREFVVGVDKLGQQRKATTKNGHDLFAKECRSQFLDQSSERLARVRLVLSNCTDLGFPRLTNSRFPKRELLPSVAF